MRVFLENIAVDHDDAGASSVEYGLLVTGIAGLIAVIVFVFGGIVHDSYDETCTLLVSQGGNATSTTCN